MIRDDHSGSSRFYPSPSIAVEKATHGLIDLCAALGASFSFMSAGSTHFQNDKLHVLGTGLQTLYGFTFPHCPWSNWVVEKLGKELLFVSRALLSELQLNEMMWPEFVPLSQSPLKHSTSPQRRNVAPMTYITARAASSPITTFLRSDTATPITLSTAQLKKSLNINSLIEQTDTFAPRRATFSHGKPPSYTAIQFHSEATKLPQRRFFDRGSKIHVKR